MRLLFVGMWFTILMVSALDHYLLVRYRDSLPEMELDPLGKLLIEFDGDIALFAAAKLVGTAVVLTILALLYRWQRTIATTVAAALVIFQLWLAYFLVR